MKMKSPTARSVPQDDSAGRHLPLVDLLVDTRTELFELAIRFEPPRVHRDARGGSHGHLRAAVRPSAQVGAPFEPARCRARSCSTGGRWHSAPARAHRRRGSLLADVSDDGPYPLQEDRCHLRAQLLRRRPSASEVCKNGAPASYGAVPGRTTRVSGQARRSTDAQSVPRVRPCPSGEACQSRSPRPPDSREASGTSVRTERDAPRRSGANPGR